MINEKTWYEVFKMNEDESTETIFADENLETCVKVYRKEKQKDRTIKIDKWLDAPYLKFPMPIKSILN
jgi:hypothetical protein